MKSVAIVYHYLAHYRGPIFKELMASDSVNYTLISGNTSDTKIRLLDEELSKINKANGGLQWLFVKNHWFFNNKILWQSGLLKMIWNGSYDSIIFLGSPYHLSTWIAIILCKFKNIKTFFWMHGFYKDHVSAGDYLKLYGFYKLVDGFFLYGNRSLQLLAKRKIKANDAMHVIYNSLNYDSSVKLRKSFNESKIIEFRNSNFSDSTLPTICFIGRVNKTKRIDMIIEVQKRYILEYHRPLFNALVIGDGEELDNLRRMVNKSFPKFSNTFKFTGAIYEESQIAHLIMYSDLCVTPGEIGLTAMHSLSYGTPVISHDNLNLQMPEVEAITQDITGCLYKYNDIDDLKIKIQSWFQRYPKKQESLAIKCYSKIDLYYNPYYQKSIFDRAILEIK